MGAVDISQGHPASKRLQQSLVFLIISALLTSIKHRGIIVTSPPRDCMTLTLVVGLVWSNESRSYAGGSIATGRVSHARLVCDEDPD